MAESASTDVADEIERLRAELAEERRLRLEQDRLFREAQRAASLGYWHWSSRGGVVEWSPELRRILGVDDAVVPSAEAFYALVHEDDLASVRAIDTRVLQTGVPEPHEYRSRRPDGTSRVLRTSGAVLTDDEGAVAGFLGVTLDVTQLRELEARLVSAQRLEAVGSLAGGIAHDFNNLLMVIQGSAHVLASARPPGDPQFAAIHAIESACDQGSRLTRQLLTFARRQQMVREDVDLAALVCRSEPLLALLVRGHATLRVEAPPGRVVVRCDPGQIEQLLLNLVVNARDAVAYGGSIVVRVVEVRTDSASGPGRVRLEVRDDGPGIPEAVQTHIFEPFFTTKGEHGTGLGLATCHGIVAATGGTISFETSSGGTTFVVELPLAASGRAAAVSGEAKASSRGARVLVVDDDHELRGLAALSLESAGYSVEQASCVADAVRAIEARTPDAIVTGASFPDGRGQDLASLFWSRSPSAPVIFASALPIEGAVEPSVPGRGRFLRKPYLLGELRAAVEAALGGS